MHVKLNGQRIFDWRWRNFVTAEEAAGMAGISVSTWLRVENGKGAVTLKTARKLAALLGVTIQELERPKGGKD
jgi:DNA-binding XRE family transcriptional regulator